MTLTTGTVAGCFATLAGPSVVEKLILAKHPATNWCHLIYIKQFGKRPNIYCIANLTLRHPVKYYCGNYLYYCYNKLFPLTHLSAIRRKVNKIVITVLKIVENMKQKSLVNEYWATLASAYTKCTLKKPVSTH